MPRRFVDEFSSERIEIDNDNFVDLDRLDAEVQQEQEHLHGRSAEARGQGRACARPHQPDQVR